MPETFIVDAKGVIRFKHTGPLSLADIDREIVAGVGAGQGRKLTERRHGIDASFLLNDPRGGPTCTTFPQTIHVGMKVFDKPITTRSARSTICAFPRTRIDPDVEPAEIDATDATTGSIASSARSPRRSARTTCPKRCATGCCSRATSVLDSDAPFTADHYVLPGQIASRCGDEVLLNIGKDELITRH